MNIGEKAPTQYEMCKYKSNAIFDSHFVCVCATGARERICVTLIYHNILLLFLFASPEMYTHLISPLCSADFRFPQTRKKMSALMLGQFYLQFIQARLVFTLIFIFDFAFAFYVHLLFCILAILPLLLLHAHAFFLDRVV